MRNSSDLLLSVLGAGWLGSIAAGLAFFMLYEIAPSPAGHAVSAWPQGGCVSLAPDRYTLIMAVHPRCPCSRASVAELAMIMKQSRPRPAAYLLVFKPARFPAGWEKTELWKSASTIAGLHLVSDEDGKESGRFGLETSGHVLVFDTRGQQRFSGGITRGRGVRGKNLGRQSILDLLARSKTVPCETPVFGCSLLDSPGLND